MPVFQDLDDLKKRWATSSWPTAATAPRFTARDIKADGAMTVLLQQAMQPNLVQTLENNPAFVHGGPFANIAHGCNSVVATTDRAQAGRLRGDGSGLSALTLALRSS